MNIERETNNQNTQAPPGTYDFLEQIGDSIFIDATDNRQVSVIKERVCAETGGSCIDLSITEQANFGKHKGYHAHITQDGTIADLNIHLWDLTRPFAFEEVPTPDIEDMFSILKNVLSRKGVDVDKFPL